MEMGRVKNKLKSGHPIHTLTSEHQIILKYLNDLEKLSLLIQKMPENRIKDSILKKLKNAAEHLVSVDPHHQREEKVLFPELEQKGVIGPPEAMRQEHQELRAQEKNLKVIVKNAKNLDFRDFKKRLKDLSSFIVSSLRSHISKEDDILYPIALEVIQEENTWLKIKSECDKIGYCCFTPKT